MNQIKICSKCKLKKPITEFYGHTKTSYCKKCFDHYTMKRWVERKKQAIEYKGSKCVECLRSYPNEPYYIFDFHHIDPSTKEYSWEKLRKRPWDQIHKELDRCVLVCANCHRHWVFKNNPERWI